MRLSVKLTARQAQLVRTEGWFSITPGVVGWVDMPNGGVVVTLEPKAAQKMMGDMVAVAMGMSGMDKVWQGRAKAVGAKLLEAAHEVGFPIFAKL